MYVEILEPLTLTLVESSSVALMSKSLLSASCFFLVFYSFFSLLALQGTLLPCILRCPVTEENPLNLMIVRMTTRNLPLP